MTRMKKIVLSICSLVVLSLLYISCSKDDIKPNKKEGTVEFGFSLKAPSHSGTQKSSMKTLAAEPAAVVVSIKKANGNSAYTMQKVDLYNMNGYYISKPLSFLPGSYTVDQFFVVDATGNVMYATPLQGSPKAYLVSEPLPISFTVSKDAVTKIVPEVLSTVDSTPEDFGYSTFSFEVIKTFDFLIGVFVYNESSQNFELTNANLTIVAASKIIFTDTLAAITNKITINDGYDNYFLTVTKDGYKTWTDTLTAAELKLYFRSEDKGPLEVILEKEDTNSNSIWFITDQTTLKDVDLVFGGNCIGMSIDWGDSTHFESIPNFINHSYATTGKYKVIIRGDVQNLTSITAVGAQITTIDISNASNLIRIGLYDNLLNTIDLSKNIYLQSLSLDFNKLETIDLSKNINLTDVGLLRNNLNKIDFSHNLKLESFELGSNSGIETIDVSSLKELKHFQAEICSLTTVDVTGNTKLESLMIVNYIGLKQMDLSNNKLIKRLSLSGKDFTNLNCTNFPNLEYLHIYFAGISNIDLTQNPNLNTLGISYCPVISLDISHNKNLKFLGLLGLSFNQENINKIFLDLYDNVSQTELKDGFVSHSGFLIPNGQALTAQLTLINNYNWSITDYSNSNFSKSTILGLVK
jgi:hypothetical protein